MLEFHVNYSENFLKLSHVIAVSKVFGTNNDHLGHLLHITTTHLMNSNKINQILSNGTAQNVALNLLHPPWTSSSTGHVLGVANPTVLPGSQAEVSPSALSSIML